MNTEGRLWWNSERKHWKYVHNRLTQKKWTTPSNQPQQIGKCLKLTHFYRYWAKTERGQDDLGLTLTWRVVGSLKPAVPPSVGPGPPGWSPPGSPTPPCGRRCSRWRRWTLLSWRWTHALIHNRSDLHLKGGKTQRPHFDTVSWNQSTAGSVPYFKHLRELGSINFTSAK